MLVSIISSRRQRHVNWILVLFLFFTVKFEWTRSKEYQSCELLVELTTKHKISVREAVKWTCLASYVSSYRTDYEDDDLYGVFGIKCDNETTSDAPKICDNNNCSLYLDDDITDDVKCARDLYGIGYLGEFYEHPKYNESDCENNLKEIVVDCFGTNVTSNNVTSERTNNCTTNICDVMTSASGQSLQTMLATIVANLNSILYDPCEAVYALHHVHNISPRDIGAWACVIMDFIKCKQSDTHLLEGDQDGCKIVGDCTKIEKYGITTTFQFCTEVFEAINDSFVLLNETITPEMTSLPNCLQVIPDTITNRCFKYESNTIYSADETFTDNEQLIFNNMLELLDKETRGFNIDDINKLEVISNSSYDPSTLDPCENLVTHFNTNITSEVAVSWMCFAREMIDCFRRERKQCFTTNCSSITQEDVLLDPDCEKNIQIVANYVKINEEIILNTPEHPLDDCKQDANLFLQDCRRHLATKKEITQDITPDETRYGAYDATSTYLNNQRTRKIEDSVDEDKPLEDLPMIPIDSNVIMSMGLALQINETHMMVEETFAKFLMDPCHIKTLLDEGSEGSEEYIASMFCFAYDVLSCSSNDAPLKCNVDCKTVRDNVIQDDAKCIERLNQIILVGEKMQKILGSTRDEYSTSCMPSFLGFIQSCKVIKEEKNQEVPIYTRWAMRPTIQQRPVRLSTNSYATEASVTFDTNDQNNELMTIRITTQPSSEISPLTTEAITETTTEEVVIESTTENLLSLEIMKNLTMTSTFDTVNACDLFRNSSASDTEFTTTFCAIYENAWCKLINSDTDCEVSCAVFNFDDDSELCSETLEIMYNIANMWKGIFIEEKLTYIPQCEMWAKRNLEKCDEDRDIVDERILQDLPVLAGAVPDDEIQTQRANSLAKERLCGIMRTFHDIYLIEEDQRSGWYCFAFDIFSCTIGRNRTVNCPVNCNNVIDSFIKADENCEKRYNYVTDIAVTIDSKFMIENNNIKPTDCRTDLRKILKVCGIVYDDYSTTITPDSTTLLDEDTKDETSEIPDQLMIESLKSISAVNSVVNQPQTNPPTTTTKMITSTTKPQRTILKDNTTIDYQLFFPGMSCSNLYELYEGISQDPAIIATYTCFYIDYIFCSVNDPTCAITCDSIEYDLIDRNACKDILVSISAKMNQFSSIVKNLTHIAEDCHPYYMKFLNECDISDKITTTIEPVKIQTTTENVQTTAEPKELETTTEESEIETSATQKMKEDSDVQRTTDELIMTEPLSSEESLKVIHPPPFDFTESQEIEDDPIVCNKLYSLKAYLNIEPSVVISYYCFLQDYILCKETEPDCDLTCRTVDDDNVRDTDACRKLVLSISRNRKHADKYMDEAFTGSIEECKARNSIACTELGDKYYITSTTIRTTTVQELVPKVNVHSTPKSTIETTSRHLPTEVTTELESRDQSTTATPSIEHQSLSINHQSLSTTTLVTEKTTFEPENLQLELESKDNESHDHPRNVSDIILTDNLNFCHLKDIFVRQLSNSDPTLLVSYFCFMQDYVSCINENETCQIDCDTVDDETLRNSELCQNAVTFVKEVRTKFPIIVTQRVDLRECKENFKNMFDQCEFTTIDYDFSTTTEAEPKLETTTILTELIPETITEHQIVKSTPKTEEYESLIVKQGSAVETSSLADFFTIGIMHPKSMAKANFQIGLKEAQIKSIIITPDMEKNNFNVAFTFHVDEEEKRD